jgi:ATP sulfurylase
MNKPLSEKEKLLCMLTEIYDQLEELESVLEASFSDLRTNMNKKELKKITVQEQRLLKIENEVFHLNPMFNDEVTDSNQFLSSRSLKLELGY